MEHTPLFNEYRDKLTKIVALSSKYGLDVTQLEKFITELDSFKVTTPIIGGFSTGKSSLLNALLGKNYLGVDLTPKTAVPTEITFGENESAILYKKDGKETISLDNFIGSEYSIDDVEKILLYINNPFLKEISTVKIVDMPGFDSGIELHNKAIDAYLPYSQAYLITFDARTPVITETIGNFLKELKLHEMPVYILITKAKSVTSENLGQCLNNIKQDAAKYLGLANVEIGYTNAKGKEIILTPLQKYLRNIENDSQQIFADNTERTLKHYGIELEKYLQGSLKQADLTESELEVEEEKCKHQLEQLHQKLSETQSDFAKQFEDCIINIQGKVNSRLESASSILESMLMNGMDVREKVNMIVREAVISAIKSDFEPKLKRYLEKVCRNLQVDLSIDSNLPIDMTQMQIDSIIKETIKKTLPAILAGIGFALTGPLGAAIGAIIGVIVDVFFAKRQQEEKRQAASQKVHQELIPQVTNKTGEVVRQALEEQIENINKQIKTDVDNQIALKEKVLADIRERHLAETEKQEQLRLQMTQDLTTVRDLMKV